MSGLPPTSDGLDEPGDGLEAALRAGEARWREVARHRTAIARSGLFDADWYRRHHPAAVDSDLPALDHYLTRGVAARASPGPLFDARAYLRQAWHLRAGLDDPLTHYLGSGIGEGRRVAPVAAMLLPDRQGRPLEPWTLLPVTSARPTVAVVVHVFYLELFGEICDALALMPYRFTLLATTDCEQKAAAIAAEVARRRLDAHLVVRVGANRGRNFGPFLLAFRDAIAGHDLMLHLHTKSSRYTGSDQSGWRQVLLRTLLPAATAINALIERFVADPRLGVLTASPGEEARYWSYAWLSNRHLAQPLFDRLGLRVPVPRGMFDYPHGGMFWARPRALARLIGHCWTGEDFPPELGQTDGTIMHAIERVVVLAAADAGYGFAELDYEHGLIRPGWSARNLDQYLRASHDGLLDTIERMGTVSFDLFDTLLTRICLMPDAVHRWIEMLATRRYPGADGYAARRGAAETAARLAPDGQGDVDLDQIHARFRAAWRDAPGGWTADAVQHVLGLEAALDLRTLRPRQAVIAALDAARAGGHRVVVTSDSYLPRRLFDAVLGGFGLLGKVDAVYLSSERRARKDRGDLWPIVAAAEPGLLHVGDNEQSDIHRTADAGIRHFHVMSPAALFEGAGLAPAADGDRPLGDDILLGPVACALFNSPYLDPDDPGAPPLAEPEQAGAVVFGPLLFAFVTWLASHPATCHLERLHFMSREGYFLKRLYDAVRTASGRNDLPPSDYFHCSRRAALAALQGLADDDAPLGVDPVLRGAGFHGSLDAFFLARLGLEPSASDTSRIRLPGDEELVRCVMELRRPEIAAHGRRALAQLRAYAASRGLDSARPLGLVDVGYSATMQTALQAATGRPLIGLYMGVSQAASQVRAGGGHAFGAFADGDVESFTGGYGLMLEAFLTAPHGQVIGYDDAVSPPAPRFRHDGLSQRQFPTLERIYAGVERYALELIACWGPELLELPFRPEAATAMLEAVRDGRLRLGPDVLGALSVEDDFCGNGEIDVFGRLLRPEPA